MTVFMVGYDASPEAEAALRLCQDIGSEDDLTVTVHVHAPGGPEGEPAPGTTEHEHVTSSSIADGLREAALRRGADLIAVGTTHRGRVSRLLPGSVTHDLMSGSPCPVAVVPATYDERPKRVVVAYDGRAEAMSALLYGKDLARKLGARLVIQGVCEPLLNPEGWVRPGSASEHATQRMQETLDTAAAAIDVDAETHVVLGQPPNAIVDSCDAGRDLLVMGSRGRGSLLGVVLGSSARYAIDHAPFPVVVAPRRHATQPPATATDEAATGA